MPFFITRFISQDFEILGPQTQGQRECQNVGLHRRTDLVQSGEWIPSVCILAAVFENPYNER